MNPILQLVHLGCTGVSRKCSSSALVLGYVLSQMRQGKAAKAIGRWAEAACFGHCQHVYTTQIGNTIKGTHSLQRGIIREPNIAARALWVHRSVTVMLLERTCGGVRPIADSAKAGSRRRRARLKARLLNWEIWDHSKTYAMNLLLVLRHQSSTWGHSKTRSKVPT